MLVPEISYTLLTLNPSTPRTLEPGDRVQLVFVGEHDAREEVHWVQVVECLQESVHRAQVLRDSEVFHDLPGGSVIYFRPEHIVRVVPAHGPAHQA
ncbi:hypothetical protein [Deinococcus sp. UYEF24]